MSKEIGARAFSLTVHPASVMLMLYTSKGVIKSLLRSQQHVFWTVSLLGILCLVCTSCFEIAYSATVLDDYAVFYWTPIHTMLGDVFVRLGIAALTSCRLYRYHLICDIERRKWVLVALVLVLCLLSASLGVTIHLRLMGQVCRFPCWRPPELLYMRNVEGLVSFIVFFLVQVINVAFDYKFFRIIADNLKKRRRAARGRPSGMTHRTIGLAFLPSAIVDAAYLSTMLVAQYFYQANEREQWQLAQFLTITLMRLAPSIEAFAFFKFTVPRTKRFLRGPERSNHRPPQQSAGSAATEEASELSSSASTVPVDHSPSVVLSPSRFTPNLQPGDDGSRRRSSLAEAAVDLADLIAQRLSVRPLGYKRASLITPRLSPQPSTHCDHDHVASELVVSSSQISGNRAHFLALFSHMDPADGGVVVGRRNSAATELSSPSTFGAEKTVRLGSSGHTNGSRWTAPQSVVSGGSLDTYGSAATRVVTMHADSNESSQA